MCSARGPASCDDGLAGRGPPHPPGSSPSGVCVRVGRTQLASAPGGGFSLANSSQGTAQSIGCHPGGGAKGLDPVERLSCYRFVFQAASLSLCICSLL